MAVATPRRVRRLLKHTPWSPGSRGEGIGVVVAVVVIAGAVVGSTSFTVVGDRPSTHAGGSMPTLRPVATLPVGLPHRHGGGSSPELATRRRGGGLAPTSVERRRPRTARWPPVTAPTLELERLVEGLVENVRPRLQRWVLVIVLLMAALLVSVSPLLGLVTLSILLARFTIAVTTASSIYLAFSTRLMHETSR
ncbi:Os11g0662525 [Oryza sativa Japonica Group]|uniref:Os11g0662525 protein n=1 Tax=Oryza sativa subsp. japonica TaxID=39947 RepID=A0A0P0Y583_ORYSJ|nr:Os11g0662525 [Oryza sativa Japonica Group]